MVTEVINGIEVTDYREQNADNLPSTLEELRAYLNNLAEEKDKIDKEIKEHSDVLRREKNIGMEGPLLDSEQFPRADIDVVAVRTARQRVICLNNDMRDIMSEIEAGLVKLHQLSPASQQISQTPTPVTPPTRPPFLKVTNVLPDSPADHSGLKDSDLVCQIGSLHKDNFTGLGDVAEVIKLSLNKAVPVKLVRDGIPKTIALKPRQWHGRGVLGCNVVES